MPRTHLPPAPRPRRRRGLGWLLPAACCLAAVAGGRSAQAQYKNMSLAIDGGWDVIGRPSVQSGPDEVITNPARFPLRLSQGARIGGETNLKMHSDHWWLNFRLNVHLMSVGSRGDQPDSYALSFDAAAKDGIGTTLGLEPAIGLRHYFLTDRVRPYLQGGLAYMRLFTFTDARSCIAGDPSKPFCGTNGSDLTSYLPHQNILSLQLQPGLELILRRDLALTFTFGYSHWFIFNAQDNDVFTPALGLSIYG